MKTQYAIRLTKVLKDGTEEEVTELLFLLPNELTPANEETAEQMIHDLADGLTILTEKPRAK